MDADRKFLHYMLQSTTTLTTNDIVINKLTQILSYLRQGRRESKKLKKLKEKGEIICINVIIFFLSISLNMCSGCSNKSSLLEGSLEYSQHMFWLRNKKINF